MIQDIAPHRYSVDYHPTEPKDTDPVLIIHQGHFYVHEDERYFTFKELSSLISAKDVRFLFTIDNIPHFTLKDAKTILPADLSENKDANPVFENALILPLSKVRSLKDDVKVFTAFTASHLESWYRANAFCGRCGSPTVDGTDERKVVCTKCGNMIYPRINPAVIAAVYDGDKLLMTRYANRPVNWLVLVAGFMEIGESAEDTVAREVLEETGVHVKNIRYFGSQPWGIPGNLTLGYIAELDGSAEVTVDTSELSEAVWVPRSEIGEEREHFSITQAMIQAFRRGEF